MNVLLVDDHPLIRKGLSSILAMEEDIGLISEAGNVEKALNILNKRQYDICIVDLKLGSRDGLEIVRKTKQKNSRTKFIMLTSSPRKEDFVRAQEVGVDGYILKEAFTEDIIYALHTVLRGRKFYDSEVVEYKINKRKNHDIDLLTPRETSVLHELGKGLSNKQIGKKLYISENTVKKHVSNILAKLHVDHRTEAALYFNEISSFG